MKVAFGFKAHSGWAALVVIAQPGGEFQVMDRRRFELVERNVMWAKQPYHAAERLSSSEARSLVKLSVESARRIALREMRTAIKRVEADGSEIVSCGVLVGSPMPNWSVDEILAVHFRMHQAEGFLFRDVLARAAKKCGLRVVEVPEKALPECASASLRTPFETLSKKVAALGKSVGAPWGKDQKEATLAALIALKGRVGS
jgi:hypothetical protein